MAPASRKEKGPSPSGKEGPASRDRILAAAVREFASQGLSGARVDSIARTAKINKQLLYYHFGSKEALYVAALERVYADLRAQERELDLGDGDPVQSVRKFVEFTFDYVIRHGEFVRLLVNENLQQARFLKQSTELRSMRIPLVDLLAKIIGQGVESGIFHADIDPVRLYITIASLCFFYASNIHTLSVFLETDLHSRSEVATYREHVLDVILRYMTNTDLGGAAARKPAAPRGRPASRRAKNGRD